MSSIFKRQGRPTYYAKFTDAHGCEVRRSTGTTDRRTAKRIAEQWEAEEALRREGVVDPRIDHLSQQERAPLQDHLEAHIESCERTLASSTVQSRRYNLEALFAAIGATRLSHLTPDRVEGHLRALKAEGKSARTVNERRKEAVAFVNWAVRAGRLDSNPLRSIKKESEELDRRRVRRELTEGELQRLFGTSGDFRPFYVTAAFTGLRRGELCNLTWGDVDLEERVLSVPNTKAGRRDRLPMLVEVEEALRTIRPALVTPAARVFPRIPTNRRRIADFKAAGIVEQDERGRFADLHCLRGTLGTLLARRGVAPQLVQAILRHRDYSTTHRHYTHLDVADMRAAMEGALGRPEEPSEAARAVAGESPKPGTSLGTNMGTRTGAEARGSSRVPAQSSDGTESESLDADRHNSAELAGLCASTRPDAGEDNDRGDRIRTYGLLLPKQALCLAELRPDGSHED